MRTAVVGHLEWIEFGHLERVPKAGDIAHATDAWEQPAGGGAVAAVQLARLSGDCTFFTALGDDPRGEWSRRELEHLGVRVEAAIRDQPTRRGVVFLDGTGERTIVTLGERLEPRAGDDLPWSELDDVDAVFVTAGDAGAIRHARRARTLVATSRISGLLAEAGVHLDAVIGSGSDPAEAFDPATLVERPDLVVRTAGSRGGRYETSGGAGGTYDPVRPPGPIVDTYGAGDSFMAGLTFALGSGLEIGAALALAARCGAWVGAGGGPYGNQLSAKDIRGGRGWRCCDRRVRARRPHQATSTKPSAPRRGADAPPATKTRPSASTRSRWRPEASGSAVNHRPGAIVPSSPPVSGSTDATRLVSPKGPQHVSPISTPPVGAW